MHQTELIGGGRDSLLVSVLLLRPGPGCSAPPTCRLVWVIHLFDARLPFVWLCLASDVYLMVFRSASTSTSRLAEKPGQDTQLITVDEKLVRIPPRAT